jgi:hypothetical protein
MKFIDMALALASSSAGILKFVTADDSRKKVRDTLALESWTQAMPPTRDSAVSGLNQERSEQP